MRGIFFPAGAYSEGQLKAGRRRIIEEGAVAAVIYSVATGNIMAGYLSYLGFSVASCAAIAMIPQLGCVLQFFSPFLFERLQYRKLSIWILCGVFRFFASLCFLLPLLRLHDTWCALLVVVFYSVSFLAAGYVTPGLQLLVLAASPQEGRGTFFARKDIAAVVFNSAVILLLSRQLDEYTARGMEERGYLFIGAVCLVFALIDSLLLLGIHEVRMPYASNLKFSLILSPGRDAGYRPFFLFSTLSGFMGGIASPFLAVYQVRVLQFSHTFITTIGAVSAAAGMIGSYVWGKVLDRSSYVRAMKITSAISLCCTLGWASTAFLPGKILAPLLSVTSATCAGAAGIASLNLQYFLSPEEGKTVYLGATSACASLAAVASAALATSLQPLLQTIVADDSIPLLFFISGTGGFLNLLYHGRRLKEERANHK